MDSIDTSDCVRAVAKLRNFSAAAEELGITQPALSSRIKKVERKLGAQLFDRSKSPLLVTGAGIAYLECQDKIEAANRELRSSINAMGNMESGRLTIGGASFFNVTYLPAAIASFSRLYPGIDIEIAEGTVPDLTARALDGKLDLFITPYSTSSSGLDYEEFLTERIFLCLPPSWPLDTRTSFSGVTARGVCQNSSVDRFFELDEIGLQAFRDIPFIVLEENQQIGRKMEELFKRHRFTPKKIIKVDQTLTSLYLTMAGVGASLVTETTLRNTALATLPSLCLIDKDICTRTLYIAHPKGITPKALAKFIQILKESNVSIRGDVIGATASNAQRSAVPTVP